MRDKTARVCEGLSDVLDGLEYHYPGEINETVARQIGRGYVAYVKPGTIAVSRDMRWDATRRYGAHAERAHASELRGIGELALDPDHEDTLAGYGEVLLKVGDRQKALGAFDRILSLGFRDDHEINAAEWIVYDALYAWCKSGQGERHDWPPRMA